MKVISICNEKGGVSKTLTTSVIMAGATEKGSRVLGIDLDAQRNLTLAKGVEVSGATIHEVLTRTADIKDAIIHTETGDLIAGSRQLATINLPRTGGDFRLKEALQPISDLYDYVIVDCPPSLGILTTNALTACDYVVVPVLADLFSLQGVGYLTRTIDAVRQYNNHDMKVAGILLTMYNSRTNLSKEVSAVIEQLAERLDTKVFDTKIRASVKASESQFKPQGLLSYAPKSKVAEDYRNFIDELLRICL